MFKAFFRMLRRIGVRVGLLIDDATDTDGFNEAMVRQGINEAKEKANNAHNANGKLNAQMALLEDQLRRQRNELEEANSYLEVAIAENDEEQGATWAEQVANLEQTVKENEQQLAGLTELYENNTQIIADSIRQVKQFEREFQQTRAQLKISRAQEELADMMASSVGELQGMVGGEMSEAMQKMRESAAQGRGKMRATVDLAKEMGSDIRMKQKAKKARGAALFRQKMAERNASKSATGAASVDVKPAATMAAKPKVAVSE